MNLPDHASLRTSRRLFLVVLGLCAFQSLVLVADRRVPLGHETGRLFWLQHAFANGDVPEPAGGAAWVEQGTLLQNALLPILPAFRSVPFVALFHLGMFLEELLLLVGVWLLGSKYYRSSYGRYVASVAALGSCLWIDNAAVNLLAFSGLPLILFFLHEFLESRARLPLLMAGLLTILQIPGRPPAFALLIPAAAALYWGGAVMLFQYPLRDRLRGCSWSRRDASGAALLLLAALAILGGALTSAQAPVRASSAPGSTFHAAVTASGARNPVEYLDMVLGFSPGLDATCYSGIFTLAFAGLALGSLGRHRSLRLIGYFLGAAAVLALLPQVLAALLPIPTRPVPLGMTLLRFVVIFLSGAGAERMLELRALAPGLPRSAAKILLLVGGTLAVVFVFNPYDDELIRRTAAALTLGRTPDSTSPLLAQEDAFRNLAGAAALTSGLAGGTLLLWSSGWRRAPLALALILILHPLDLFGWKFRMTWMKSCSLSPAQASAQALVGMPALPFPGTEPVTPPFPARLARPYGLGPTPLRAVPKDGVAPRPLDAAGARFPIRLGCRVGLGVLSVLVIGWTLRRVVWLAGTGQPCPRSP